MARVIPKTITVNHNGTDVRYKLLVHTGDKQYGIERHSRAKELYERVRVKQFKSSDGKNSWGIYVNTKR